MLFSRTNVDLSPPFFPCPSPIGLGNTHTNHLHSPSFVGNLLKNINYFIAKFIACFTQCSFEQLA